MHSREFYESTYHFDYDVGFIDERRVGRALELLEPLTGTSFLDLGSGVGWASHLTRKRGAGQVVGIDFAFRALQLGQTSLPDVDRVQGDGCQLPFRSASFDRLLSFGSLEHFPDVPQGVREIARVLKPGGRAVVVVPNFFSKTEQPQELRLSQTRWTQLFADAGLSVLRVRPDAGPPVFRDRRPTRVALRSMAKVLAYVPRLPYQFIFELGHAPDNPLD